MPDLSEVTEAHVRRWIDARSFERGQGYFRTGRIRTVYRRTGDAAASEAVFDAIREDNNNLPAFQDERGKARL